MAEIRGYEDAAAVAGASHIYNFNTPKRELKVECPKCGKTMYVNLQKGNGTHHCFHCGFGGSVIDFYAALVGIDEGSVAETRKKAGIDFNKRVEGDAKASRPAKKRTAALPDISQFEIADIKTRDKTYRGFLNMLTLEEVHKKDLLRRGLTEEVIKRNGYKTAPIVAIPNLCATLLEKGFTLEGVPGFYKKDGEWTFVKYGAGYLIPTLDINSNIQGLQLRTEKNPNTDVKYTRYFTVSSSSYDSGTRGKTFPHVRFGDKEQDEIILTEGPLKADIISELTGRSVVAVLGVNCLENLPLLFSGLRRRGCKKVYIAYDMDMFSNENVLDAYNKLKRCIISNGLSIQTLEWETEYKGLDDYLAR